MRLFRINPQGVILATYLTLLFSYMSLGVRNVDDGDIDKMMAEAPGALDFTTFLNMLAEKLHGTDSEDVILEGKFGLKVPK